MNQQVLSALRKELEHSFGRRIRTSRDCLQLVDDIYHKTGYTINANTLRRFFGIVKSDYSASPSTVIILSKYCGFDSIDQIGIIAAAEHVEDTAESISKEEVMHYLVSLFKSIRPAGYNAAAESMVQQTILFLERNRSFTDRFQREIAKTDAGQYYYYELSVNMDRLDDYYGNGLRYYLRSSDTNEAKAFAHSLQVFRYWLTENQALLEKHMAELQAIPVNNNFPAHILGRLMAARLLYAHTQGDPVDKVIGEAARYYAGVVADRGRLLPAFVEFELIFAEALILTNHHEEASEYLRKGKSFFRGSAPRHPFSFWENVIRANKNYIAKTTDISRKNTMHDRVTYPQNKRYNALLYLVQNPRVRQSQLTGLIKETGFTRFQHLYTR